MIRMDASEVNTLAADLGKIPARTVPAVTAVVTKGAQNVKEQMRDEAESGGTTRHFSRSISYDVSGGLGGVEAKIGPDKERTQGALGNLLYFGTSTQGPVLDIQGPLTAEEPKFEKELGNAIERSFR